MRLRLLLASAAVPALLMTVQLVSPQGEAVGAQLDEKIEDTRRELGKRKGKEKVLTSDIARVNARIATLQAGIDRIAAREATAQADLDAHREELTGLQTDLRHERARVVRLRARLAEARAVLSERLVALYQADPPDLVSVVVNAHGFADLIERADFISRIGAQDRRITTRVRDAKHEATTAVGRLRTLEARQARATARVQSRRDEIAELRREEVAARSVFDRARDRKATTLSSVRSERKDLEGHLASLEKEQAKVQATLAGAGAPSGGFTGSGGPLSMPVNGTFSSPFGYRWGRLHAGVDLAAPEGTQITAADSGRVVLASWTGGYGNYTCVQHSASMTTCYAHQSRYGTTVGADVRRGQVIGYVGNTGHSFGAHLHFEVRINGNPVNPVPYL